MTSRRGEGLRMGPPPVIVLGDLAITDLRRILGTGYSMARGRWEDGFGNPIANPYTDDVGDDGHGAGVAPSALRLNKPTSRPA